jgi:uncharacterized RDD family membrane protein YckC
MIKSELGKALENHCHPSSTNLNYRQLHRLEMDPEDLNPYAAPQSSAAVHTPEDFSAFQTAEGGKRFLNFLIDRAAEYGVEFSLGALFSLMDQVGVTAHGAQIIARLSPAGYVFFSCGATIAYYTVCEGLWGRTLGKLATGTRAVMISGAPLSWNVALQRSLLRLVPFEAFSFLGSRASGWHDRWTSTCVIDLRAVPVPKPRAMGTARLPRFYSSESGVMKPTAKAE